MTKDEWIVRSHRSLRSAQVVLNDGDANTACSQAYYAMFYAARAALLALGEEEAAMAKTHSGLIASFNGHLVRSGAIAKEHGANLGAEANRRLLADYQGDPVEKELAELAITHATAFVDAVECWIGSTAG